MTPIDRIDQAFLQLEFAIKLLNYVTLEKVNKEEFDVKTIVLLKLGNITFPQNGFNDYRQLIFAAENNYNITLGFTAITLDASFDLAKIKNDPHNHTPEGNLRTLVYMIRCAFAHDMMQPKWEAKGPYKRQLELTLPNYSCVLDLPKFHEESFFDVRQIGGMEAYFEIKDEVKKIIERHTAGENQHERKA